MTGDKCSSPQFYGEEKQLLTTDYNLTRDEFERSSTRSLASEQAQSLAICRGVQLVNVAFGGTSNQNIEGHWQGLPLRTTFLLGQWMISQLSKLFSKRKSSKLSSAVRALKIYFNFRVTAVDHVIKLLKQVESIDEPVWSPVASNSWSMKKMATN